MLGVRDLRIIPARGEEKYAPGLPPAEIVRVLSRAKAEEVAAACAPEDVVVAADTVVWVDDRVFGKPKDRAEAVAMLHTLSGRGHEVFTGVTVLRGGECRSETERTEVFFRPLTDREIEAYVDSGEPMDKAGAYGVQGQGALLVERIDGDFFNVMGLPVEQLGLVLARFGVKLL